MKRALVTGGAGFIGSNLALELERRGIEVVVLDDFSSGHFENLRGFTGDCVAGDVSRPEEWAGRVGAVDAVFHQAAITDTTVTDQKRMLEVNVEGFRNILSFALESGVRRVVYASSAGVYGAGRIPMREGDRGWADMQAIERRLPELAEVPTTLLWAPEDAVFPIEYAQRLKELLPHAEGPITFDNAAHFLQDDRGPDIARAIVEFLDRTVGPAP